MKLLLSLQRDTGGCDRDNLTDRRPALWSANQRNIFAMSGILSALGDDPWETMTATEGGVSVSQRRRHYTDIIITLARANDYVDNNDHVRSN